MLLWQIWKSRNAFLFENASPDPIFVFTQASKLLQEFWDARGWVSLEQLPNVPNENTDNEQYRWKPPEGNYLKINSDCAFSPSDNRAAVVFVVRDSNGWLLDGAARLISADSALEAEGIALYDAFDNQLEDVQFESDNQVLIKCLTDDSPPNEWRCFNILENIQFSRNLIKNHSCNWISKKTNLVADWVAKALLGGSCLTDWVLRLSSQLRRLLERDTSSVQRAPD